VPLTRAAVQSARQPRRLPAAVPSGARVGCHLVLAAIALPYNTLPLHLIERCNLDSLAHDRGGEKELQFHFTVRVPLLPA